MFPQGVGIKTLGCPIATGLGGCDKSIPCARPCMMRNRIFSFLYSFPPTPIQVTNGLTAVVPSSFTCALAGCTCSASGICQVVGDVGAVALAVQPGSVLEVQGNFAGQGSLTIAGNTIAPVVVVNGTVQLSGPLQINVGVPVAGNSTFPIITGNSGLLLQFYMLTFNFFSQVSGQFSVISATTSSNCSNTTASQQSSGSVLSVVVSVDNSQCQNGSMSIGMIVGIVIGAIALGAAIGLAIILVRKAQINKFEKDFSAAAMNDLKNNAPYSKF